MLPVLLPAVYHYICTGEDRMANLEIPDPLIRTLLEKVARCILISLTHFSCTPRIA
jgi:hypothetical protein